MNHTKQVAVIIPFYKSTLTAWEEISLTQCFKILGAYPIIAVKPLSLDIESIIKNRNFTEVQNFEDRFFENVQGYNALMLSSTFYERFLEYELILIHQLDAFVFRDDLQKWCQSGYDYIGAPWLKREEDKGIVNELKTKVKSSLYTFFNLTKYGVPSDRQFDNVVGNGGFSLRRVKKFYNLARKFSSKQNIYLKRTEFQFHEDVFWSIEINRKWNWLRIPPYKTALGFSFENRPERALKLTNNIIPFGCHAWDLHTDFWFPYFDQLGYDIQSSID